LQSLFLQENLIDTIENLDHLTRLKHLNLSDNKIQVIEGLDHLIELETLQLRRNRIGANGYSDLVGLLVCPKISVLDLSHNPIQDPAVLPEIFFQMPALAVLYLEGNGLHHRVKNYRK